MKATGIVRKIDDLGRFVIPIEMRRMLGISEGDSMEVYVSNDSKIILAKYSPACTCIFCGEESEFEYKGKRVCNNCVNDVSHVAITTR